MYIIRVGGELKILIYFKGQVTNISTITKMYRCTIYNVQISGHSGGDPFRLLNITFLYCFCGDLTVLIFPTLLADIEDPI